MPNIWHLFDDGMMEGGRCRGWSGNMQSMVCLDKSLEAESSRGSIRPGGAGEVMSVGGRGRYARTKFQSFVLGTLFLLLTGHDSIPLRLPSKFDATQQKLELELNGSCAQSASCSCPFHRYAANCNEAERSLDPPPVPVSDLPRPQAKRSLYQPPAAGGLLHPFGAFYLRWLVAPDLLTE